MPPQGDEKMNSSITVPAVYVGTYHQYNCGSIFGKWFDLTDFDDEDAFYDACRTLHAGEEDPELMFQDWRAFRHSLPLNPLLSGRLLRLSGRRRTTGAPPRLWPGRSIPASATMTPLMTRITAKRKVRKILLMALWRTTAC
jgi:hypothetical protein